MQKITPFLWFNGQTKEAMEFYTSVFKDSKIIQLNSFNTPQGPMATGTFELNGQRFMALDGGPMFQFTEAISMFVDCKDQEEVDYYWNKLTEGGEESQCGWLKDKFGLSWQIVPSILGELMYGNDGAKAGRVMQTMMTMKKIIVSELENAAKG